ncbi:MAG: hypothetical protein ABI844_06010 [Saprospiraceae bacterium]
MPKTKNHSIKIVLDTEEPLPDGDTIYITGNDPVLGKFANKGLPMTRRAEMRWETKFPIDSNHLQFKFTLGSMDKEAITNIGEIPTNSHLHIVSDTEVYFVIEDWKMSLEKKDSSKD